jgi:hypothetical protein
MIPNNLHQTTCQPVNTEILTENEIIKGSTSEIISVSKQQAVKFSVAQSANSQYSN